MGTWTQAMSRLSACDSLGRGTARPQALLLSSAPPDQAGCKEAVGAVSAGAWPPGIVHGPTARALGASLWQNTESIKFTFTTIFKGTVRHLHPPPESSSSAERKPHAHDTVPLPACMTLGDCRGPRPGLP